MDPLARYFVIGLAAAFVLGLAFGGAAMVAGFAVVAVGGLVVTRLMDNGLPQRRQRR